MPFEDDTQALADIAENIGLVSEFTDEMRFAASANDKLRHDAVSRCLEISSEASRRLTEAPRSRHKVAWRATADVGNFYRHEYHKVLSERVWATAQQDLGPLKAAVAHELRARGLSESESPT